MSANVWQKCLSLLQEEYPAQQFNTWLRPLQAEGEEDSLVLLAPNRFVVDWVKKHFFERIKELVSQISADAIKFVSIEIGSKVAPINTVDTKVAIEAPSIITSSKSVSKKTSDHYKNCYLNKKFVFENGEANIFANWFLL